jgi:hypothetical protein
LDLLVDLVVLVLDLDLAVQVVVDHHHHLLDMDTDLMDHLDFMEDHTTSIEM